MSSMSMKVSESRRLVKFSPYRPFTTRLIFAAIYVAFSIYLLSQSRRMTLNCESQYFQSWAFSSLPSLPILDRWSILMVTKERVTEFSGFSSMRRAINESMPKSY